MSRSRLSAVLAGAVALGTLSLFPLAGTAAADPTFAPDATDVVGVGSDTTEFAMTNLADGTTVGGTAIPGYNAGRTGGRLVSWNATGTSPISLRSGTAPITRPNGSTAGKNLLYNPSNPDVNYARSSSSLSATEVGAGLFQVPFAVDGLKMAVRAAGSNAPASISPADVLAIYKGDKTTWNQVGGTSSNAIHPLIPQSGSGTRSFFLAQLKALNGGTDVTLAGSVTETQEHSDVDIKDNPDALAPFSTGRAGSTPTIALLGGQNVGGFEAKRALYNVVRQADLSASWFAPIFGSGGFICSNAAKPLVEAAGFGQLATAANGGVCGEPTQSATTNFTTNTFVPARATTTALTGSVSSQTVTLKATVSASGATPEGTVTFYEGSTAVGTTGLSGGVAIVTKSAVPAGSHTYKATYTPTNAAAFVASQSTPVTVTVAAPVTTTVKKVSKTTVTMPTKFSKSQRVKATIKVVRAGKPAVGKVRVTMGTKLLAKGKLYKGKLVVKLPRLAKGKHKLVFRYLGNATTYASKAVVKVRVTA